MATVMVKVWLNRGDPKSSDFQSTPENFEFARVPSVGEFVNLGNDSEHESADYRVAIVVHAPLRPSGVDAEIFLERVFLPYAIQEVSDRIGANPNDRSHLMPADEDEETA